MFGFDLLYEEGEVLEACGELWPCHVVCIILGNGGEVQGHQRCRQNLEKSVSREPAGQLKQSELRRPLFRYWNARMCLDGMDI
jgi:hypothetical protein